MSDDSFDSEIALLEKYMCILGGEILAANFLVTGREIPASESVVIFSRIINSYNH